MDPRNGLSQDDWADDGVQTIEKESDHELLAMFEQKMRHMHANVAPSTRLAYSLDQMESEIIRRMGFCKRE